jgi:hypothetical protein
LVVRVWRNCTHFAYPVVYHANWTIRKWKKVREIQSYYIAEKLCMNYCTN